MAGELVSPVHETVVMPRIESLAVPHAPGPGPRRQQRRGRLPHARV